jgi:zinc transport system substrate-binding protein
VLKSVVEYWVEYGMGRTRQVVVREGWYIIAPLIFARPLCTGSSMMSRFTSGFLPSRQSSRLPSRLSLLWLALAWPGLSSAAPSIAVSIKPLQLIAAAVTDGLAEPKVVWAQGQDPHHVSLRPSERRLLGAADLVLWTGPMLERPLASLVGELDAQVLTVQHLPGITLIDVEGQPDPHVWVDTGNARTIAAALSEALAQLDPANAAQYESNRAGFVAALDALDTELQQDFTGSAQRAWSVYHHALRYLERALGLQAPITLADSENNAPGLRTARRVRAQLQQENLSCMLAEPDVNHDEVQTMLGIAGFRVIDADVMNNGDAPDYITYLRALATTLRDCLGPVR